MVLGYDITTCPFCNEGQLTQNDQTVRCSKCGRIEKPNLLAKILCTSRAIASKLIAMDDYGEVIGISPNDVIAYNEYEHSINACNEDNTQVHNFPTLYPRLPEGDFILLDSYVRPDFTSIHPFAFFKGGWCNEWNSKLYNRTITILYRLHESECRFIAKELSELGVHIRIGRLTGVMDEDYHAAIDFNPRLSTNEQHQEPTKSMKGVNLRELIESYHHIISNGRLIYRPTLNVPVSRVVDDVVQWFKDNGARFLWDTTEDVGYMLFRAKLYTLREANPLFRSLLKELGGITRTTSEGKAIAEGLTCLADISEELKPTPWLECNPDTKTISLRQGDNIIRIKPEGVTVDEIDTLSYDLILGEKKWFTSIKIVGESEYEGLQLLWPKIANYFACSNEAREILICWLLSVFLAGYSSIRPGVRVSGPASTGKSTMLQMLYWLFYGKDEAELPAFPTVAGLWRVASMEPFIPLDNKNMEGMGEDIRTFLDVAATGGKRMLGVAGGDTREVRIQKAHTLVLISGLDVSLHHDVRTRYFEIETSPVYKSGFYCLKQKQELFANRDLIMTSVFNLLSKEVLPTIEQYTNEEMAQRYRILLGNKERTVDYFLIMLAIGEALQRKGVISDGNLGIRWTNYIRQRSEKTDRATALSIEWWKNFQIGYLTNRDQWINLPGSPSECPFNLIRARDKVTGIRGTPEEMLNAMSWTARVLNRKLPWATVREFVREHNQDQGTWDQVGWRLSISEKEMTVEWGEGI